VVVNMKINCKECERLFEKRLLSKKGYCRVCAWGRRNQSVRELREKKGEFYEKWKTNWEKGIKKYLKGKKRGKKCKD